AANQIRTWECRICQTQALQIFCLKSIIKIFITELATAELNLPLTGQRVSVAFCVLVNCCIAVLERNLVIAGKMKEQHRKGSKSNWDPCPKSGKLADRHN